MIELDHLALFVADETRSRDWYVSHFGFRVAFEVPERNTIALQDDADLTVFLVREPARAARQVPGARRPRPSLREGAPEALLGIRRGASRPGRLPDPALGREVDAREGRRVSPVEIRPARLGDAAALAVLVRGFRDHLAASAPSDAEIERHLPRALADPAIEFCAAWLDGEAVGYTQTRFWTSLWAAGMEAQLDDLFVAPAARGRSVGRSLLRHAIARAAARGALRFGLNTNEWNEAAQALYRSEGLAPQSHALYPGGREVFWVKRIGAADL
jgi:ribosomal protein S18 acetylase RimI-like enzyme